MIHLTLIYKDNCPKCEYVKNLFNGKLNFGQPIFLEMVDFKNIDPQFFKDNNIIYAPVIVAQNGKEKMFIKEGMTKENIERKVNEFYRNS